MTEKNHEPEELRGGQFLTFRLEQEMYGVPIATVLEVLDYVPVTNLPCSREILTGVINLRGAVVPVADIRIKFGMAKTLLTKSSCIIVVRVDAANATGKTTVGVLADQVMAVAEIASSNIQKPPDMGTGVPTQYLRGIGKIGKKFFMILDVDVIIYEDMQSFAAAR